MAFSQYLFRVTNGTRCKLCFHLSSGVSHADDDCYFFIHNFRDFIAGWDPDAPHYFGNTMSYDVGRNDFTGDKKDHLAPLLAMACLWQA